MPAPPSATTDRVTAAFARETDARYTIGILERSGVEPVDIDIDLVEDGRGGIQLVIMCVKITALARDRVLSAISGGHGVPIPEPLVAARPVGVA